MVLRIAVHEHDGRAAAVLGVEDAFTGDDRSIDPPSPVDLLDLFRDLPQPFSCVVVPCLPAGFPAAAADEVPSARAVTRVRATEVEHRRRALCRRAHPPAEETIREADEVAGVERETGTNGSGTACEDREMVAEPLRELSRIEDDRASMLLTPR
jgi:hypothetical protein